MKKLTLGIGIMALVFVVFGNQASAYKGDPNIKSPNYTEERHELMLNAFENKDYSLWKSLMQNKGKVTSVVNQENFHKFIEAHKLALSGDVEGAKKIRSELGLGIKDGSGKLYKNSFRNQYNKKFNSN